MNEALLKPDQWMTAQRLVREAGLKPHQDGAKNWDHFLAFESILKNVDQAETVLDAGGYFGTFTPWLVDFGYSNVVVMNKEFKDEVAEGGVKKIKGDITKTILGTASVGAMTCMSVIEHGVDHDKFLDESYRIIKPGGRLILSTDYWPDKINTEEKHDDLYGCPVVIYSAAEIRGFVEKACKRGFRPSSIPCYAAADRCVNWERMGLQYTFIVFEFIRDLRDA